MNLPQEQARLLIECLPYIRRFYGETVVIKYGGHAMENGRLKQAFALNIALLRYVGIHPVIVHGGGPQIGRMLENLHIKSTFYEGQRVTDEATMEVVEMVLVGTVNSEIVNLLNLAGVKAVGLSGKDGHSVRAEKLLLAPDNAGGQTEQSAQGAEIIDLGKVGKVAGVDAGLILSLSADGFIPVIAPVGVDKHGETYNINADSVAGAVAAALKAKRLLLLTDVEGVLDADKKLIQSIPAREARILLADGTLKGGMIPKIRCCLEALEGGVEKAMIIDGRVENCILLELFTNSGIGTEIVHSAEDTGVGEHYPSFEA
ncbi:MAG: acetylglutamate kinase [Deltaproteobacteria bacterium]|jgi:acetylglutamate kinase|nr:acetylglutamate kinase [Deltaproteobacteria bacterium]